MKRLNPPFSLSLLPVLALLSILSCRGQLSGWGSAHSLKVFLPSVPESWSSAGEFRFVVEWRDEGGLRREAFASSGSRLDLVLARGSEQAILAWPEFGLRRLKPAGALYPFDLEGFSASVPGAVDEIRLSWMGGWTAELFECVRKAGGEAGLGNFRRIESRLTERGDDPWELDPRIAAERLMAGSLRADFFGKVERYAIAIPVDGGPWILESPLAPPPEPTATADAGGDGSSSWRVSLPEGESLVLGGDFDLAASVDSGGSFRLVRIGHR